MILQSIRFKIILWYMLILAVTLAVFSGVIFHIFRTSLYDGLDDLLLSEAEGVANSIDTYWETEKIEAVKDGIKTTVFIKINNLNFRKIAQHWVEEKSNDPRLISEVVQIFNDEGMHIASSRNVPSISALPDDALGSVLKGKGYFHNLEIATDKRPLYLRAVTIPVFENRAVAYIVRVAIPLDTINTALGRLKTLLFVFLPLTVFSTGIIGAFLAKITLHPVDDMIRTIQQIKSDNLKLRIAIPDTEDEIKKLSKTFNDMLEELDKAFSLQKQFTQDVSHELRTPLTILRGEMEVALKKIRSPKEYETVLKSSLEEINKMQELADNLLILARFDSRQVPFEPRELSLNELVEDVLKKIAKVSEQKKISLVFSCSSRITLEGDESQLTRLFVNLVDNAVKYTPEGGSIDITASTATGKAEIKISDTGTGIDPQEIPLLFDRFYRAEKSRSSVGFGLGLSISKSIIDNHKGSIRVESMPGKGATFIVSLPLTHGMPQKD
jgi:two-component system, OmpR family, sensor kinase